MERQKIQRFGSTIGNFMPFDDNGIWVRWEDVAPYIMEAGQPAHNTGMDAISLAREYQRVCSKNNYMFNMLCEFISWVQEKQHHT